ncbi:MAG: endonuclease/exonuclease/phosphatase family protein [archaeon]
MKLLTYNILDGGRERTDILQRIITGQQPDIVALQEANNFSPEQLAAWKTALGMQHYILARGGEQTENGTYDVVLFSKHPLHEVKALKLRNAAAFGAITYNKELCIGSVHLSPYTEDDRKSELEQILSAITQYKNCILLGDFNSLSHTDDYGNSWKNWSERRKKRFMTNGRIRHTITNMLAKHGFVDVGNHLHNHDLTYREQVRIDYVFVTKPLLPDVKAITVLKHADTAKASDHYPIVVEFSSSSSRKSSTS